MSEKKTKEEVIAEVSEQNEFNCTEWKAAAPMTYDLVLKFMEAYHLQFKPSDEDIWDMVQEKYFRASVENKNERIRNDVTAMKHLRDKIFK